jgi:hypothetical protein
MLKPGFRAGFDRERACNDGKAEEFHGKLILR